MATELELRKQFAAEPPVEYQGPSRLQKILTGLGAGLQRTDANSDLNALQQQAQRDFALKQQQLDAKRANLLQAAQAEQEQKNAEVSAPAMREIIKQSIPGLDAALIDKMDPMTLQKTFPQLHQAFKLAIDAKESKLREAVHADTKAFHNDEISMRRQELENRKEETAIRREEAQANTEAKKAQKDLEAVDKSLNTIQGVARGANAGDYGMGVRRSTLAADAERLISQIKSGEVIGDPRVQAELATTLQGIMSVSGTPGQEMIKHLMAKTRQTDFAKLAEYITNKPQEAIAKDFLAQMEHQISGQGKYWREVRDNTITSQYEQLKNRLDKNPETKQTWLRAVRSKYPDFNFSRLGVKAEEFGDPVSAAAGTVKTSTGFTLKVPQ